MNLRYRNIRRAVITGPESDRGKAFHWLNENQYNLISSGPKKLSRFRVDLERFKMIAEKRIK